MYGLEANRVRAESFSYVCVSSQLPWAQNNPHAKVVYFGAACSASLHMHSSFDRVCAWEGSRDRTGLVLVPPGSPSPGRESDLAAGAGALAPSRGHLNTRHQGNV